jgi:WD40 repeat protein
VCSFSNRNEIHVFDLRKFPSKPHKVLKSSNHPSSGYNDLLFLPAPESPQPQSLRRVGMKAKPRPRTSNVIAGDMDGAIRMWDPRSPLRPVWSVLTGSQPVNALVLSPNRQFLICGNEAGMLMVRFHAPAQQLQRSFVLPHLWWFFLCRRTTLSTRLFLLSAPSLFRNGRLPST